MIHRTPDAFTSGQQNAVSDVLGAAFAQDPLMTYVFPDPTTRTRNLRNLFRPTVRCSRRCGGVNVTAGGEGALTWRAGASFPLRLSDLVWSGMIVTPLQIGLAAFTRLQGHETFCEHEMAAVLEDRCAYLWALGVSPTATGKGFGRQLIQAALTDMRRQGYSRCLLKTENQSNVALYEHLGFQHVHTNIVPHSGLRYWVLQKEV